MTGPQDAAETDATTAASPQDATTAASPQDAAETAGRLDATTAASPQDASRETLPPGVAEEIRAAVYAEFTPVLDYVAEALARNKAFEEMSDRLRAAERRLEARRERPLVAAAHRLLDRLRHLEFDPVVKRELEADIVKMLRDAGFEETGQVGEAYDPVWHEAIEGRAVDSRARVSKVHTRGLKCLGDVVFRARVQILPEPRHDADGAATVPRSEE
jgi:uncharacterized protein with beta-barrel porin domain